MRRPPYWLKIHLDVTRFRRYISNSSYQTFVTVRIWPKPAIHQISVNGRFRCQAAVEVPPKRAQMPSQSKLGMALFATARMYLASVTSDLCPVCSRICHGCRPVMAACVQYPARRLCPLTLSASPPTRATDDFTTSATDCADKPCRAIRS